jgi:hypothetical protein
MGLTSRETTAPAVMLGQGQTVTVDWPAVAGTSATVSGPAGLELDIENGKLTVHADYTLSGTKTAVAHHVDAGTGQAVDMPIAITVKPLVWKPRNAWTTGPEGREHGSLLFDPAANTAFLLGGSGYAPAGVPLADTWKLDLATGRWTAWRPGGHPPPAAASRRIAEIPDARMGYLFGGYTQSSDLNDLYRVAYANGDATFTKLSAHGAPSARELHVFAYDANAKRFVVFGGYGQASNSVLSDTWLLAVNGDTPTWTSVSTPRHPSARYGGFYGMDDANRRLLVWSGAQGVDSVNAAEDVWALDLGTNPPTWAPIDVPGDKPGGRRNGCFVFDPRGPRLLVLGGTSDASTTEPGLWFLDTRPGKEHWTRVDVPGAPPLRSSNFGFVDATGDIYCGFGNDDSQPFRDITAIGY